MQQERRVVVTGIGVIAGNGNNREEFYQNSVNGVTGIKECTIFDVSKIRTKYVGQISKELPVIQDTPTDRTRFQEIVRIALNDMFEDAGITKEDIKKYGRRASLAIGVLSVTNDKINGFNKDMRLGKFEPGWLTRVPDFMPWVKKEAGVLGGAYTTAPACASGTVAAGIGFDLIKQGKADIVIVGGAEQLTQVSCNGFHSLRSLSTSICKPFDQDRDGINLGEAGTFMLLETEESALKNNRKIYGEILGYGTNNEAYHITSPDPEGNGACATMKMAMKNTGVEPKDINLINAHGTGTKLNDAMETTAVNRFFKDCDGELNVSTNKSMIGHCLGGAGAVELAATLLCVSREQYMPNINLDNPLELDEGKQFVMEAKKGNIKYALSSSFAFAGNTASILVGKY